MVKTIRLALGGLCMFMHGWNEGRAAAIEEKAAYERKRNLSRAGLWLQAAAAITGVPSSVLRESAEHRDDAHH
jgi:hypothetical protein